jgi:hypothetical protein
VLTVKADVIEATPTFFESLDARLIPGIAKTTDGIKILLDIDWVMKPEEMTALKDIT